MPVGGEGGSRRGLPVRSWRLGLLSLPGPGLAEGRRDEGVQVGLVRVGVLVQQLLPI